MKVDVFQAGAQVPGGGQGHCFLCPGTGTNGSNLQDYLSDRHTLTWDKVPAVVKMFLLASMDDFIHAD